MLRAMSSFSPAIQCQDVSTYQSWHPTLSHVQRMSMQSLLLNVVKHSRSRSDLWMGPAVNFNVGTSKFCLPVTLVPNGRCMQALINMLIFFMVVIKFITLQIKYFKSRYCYHLAPKAFSRSLRPWCLVPLWSMDLWRSQSLGLWDWVHIVSGIHMSDPKIVFRTFTLLTYMCMRVFLIFTHRHFYIYIELPAAPETLWIITPLFTMIPPSDCRTSWIRYAMQLQTVCRKLIWSKPRLRWGHGHQFRLLLIYQKKIYIYRLYRVKFMVESLVPFSSHQKRLGIDVNQWILWTDFCSIRWGNLH